VSEPNAERALTALSQWVDASYPVDIAPETVLWRRIAKIGEEHGEVIQALIGAVGENPRKGVTHTMADVCEELLDVAVCALAAYEHVTEHQGLAVEMLEWKILRVAERAGVVDA
jgi:hypothetical protein